MSVPTLKQAIHDAEPIFDYFNEDDKNYINSITSRANGLGLTSLSFVGRCDFDGELYGDDKVSCDGILGLRQMYPYNMIQYRDDKKWMFDCLCMYKYLLNGTFPNSRELKYHNLPHILKVPRSDGTTHDAITTCPYYGIQVRKPTVSSKSKSDKVNIYVTLVFHDSFKSLKDEDVEIVECADNANFKDIKLEDLVEVNPTLKGKTLLLRYYALPIYPTMFQAQAKAIKYFNTIQKNWCEKYLAPVLKKYTDDGIMRCSYEIC